MIHAHSLFTYQQIRNLPEKRASVYEIIKNHPHVTDKEIAQLLGWEINRVTGRRGELVRDGLVEQCGKRFVEGKPNAEWRAI